MNLHLSNRGFTITELLVALTISSIVMTGVLSNLQSQHKSYLTQDQLAVINQNLRAAIYLMEREIRMAGHDPTGTAGAGIVTANGNSIRITADITDNSGTDNPDGDTGDPGEDVTYALFDTDGDGDLDLGRNDVNGLGNQAVAENIDAIHFVYLDQNGNTPANAADIRSIQITVVARALRPDHGYTDTHVYTNQKGQVVFTPSANDHFRRKLLTAEVKCRNLGLE